MNYYELRRHLDAAKEHLASLEAVLDVNEENWLSRLNPMQRELLARGDEIWLDGRMQRFPTWAKSAHL